MHAKEKPTGFYIYIFKANIYQYKRLTRNDKGKNGKIGKFGHINKFSKYGALTYYNHCDPKILWVSLYFLWLPR